jgi:hypothetical protein
MKPYIDAGKPVFTAEYTDLPGDFEAFCLQSQKLVHQGINEQAVKRQGLCLDRSI